MKTLLLIFTMFLSAQAQDTTGVISIANNIGADGITFAKSDSIAYLRIYFVGDSIKADYDRMKPDRAVQEFFNLVAAAKYRTTTNFFVGDTVIGLYPDGYQRKGVVEMESQSGRLLLAFYETHKDKPVLAFKMWFDPYYVEAYIP